MRKGRQPLWLPGLIGVAVLCLVASNRGVDLRAAITFATDMVSAAVPGTKREIVTGDATAGLAGLINTGSIARSANMTGYQWWSRREDQLVKLRGMVPSEEDRKTIHGMIKANMPDLEIDDRMEVAGGGPSKQMWLGAVSFALLQLSQLSNGTAWLTGTDLSIEGRARTAAALAAIETATTKRMPLGIDLKKAAISPPIAKPFSWTAAYEDAALTLTGHVPSDEAREHVMHHARTVFGEIKIMDRMELAAGAPKDWAEAAAVALRQLARLNGGAVSLTDTALAMEGIAATKGLAEDIAAVIKQELPKGYSAKDSIRQRSNMPDDSSRASPRRGSLSPT